MCWYTFPLKSAAKGFSTLGQCNFPLLVLCLDDWLKIPVLVCTLPRVVLCLCDMKPFRADLAARQSRGNMCHTTNKARSPSALLPFLVGRVPSYRLQKNTSGTMLTSQIWTYQDPQSGRMAHCPHPLFAGKVPGSAVCR